MTYDALLLAGFGGPEAPDEVMPFLERVTAGRGVPRERLEEVSHHYLELGGVSPINQQNRDLLAAMREEFVKHGINQPIYWGNRNSEPYFADVLKQIHDDGHKRVLMLATSAYSSYSGCRQYRENLAQALIETELVGELTVDKLRVYFDHPGFIAPFAEGLRDEIRKMNAQGISNNQIKVFYCTHSIPNKMAETAGPPATRDSLEGGAYVAQHLVSSKLVHDEAASDLDAEMPQWQLVYQSRSGSPEIPWLEPDINDAINEAAEQGFKATILVPVGFVSDHIEVIWDLDNEAKETAENAGLAFARVLTPGVAPKYLSGLAELVAERVCGGERKALSELGPWADFCAVGCCPNLRRDLPVVAEAQPLN